MVSLLLIWSLFTLWFSLSGVDFKRATACWVQKQHMCLTEQVILKIPQNSQENTCDGVSF